MMCNQIVNIVEYAKVGSLKAYAVTGETRSAMLPNVPTTTEAVASGNASRVKAFFNGFQREQAPATQAAPSTQSSNRRASLMGKIYTRDQIANFYELHRKGTYTGREAEWARLEYEIIAAGREGRILGAVDLHGK
jgi:hypothetical protein